MKKVLIEIKIEQTLSYYAEVPDEMADPEIEDHLNSKGVNWYHVDKHCDTDVFVDVTLDPKTSLVSPDLPDTSKKSPIVFSSLP